MKPNTPRSPLQEQTELRSPGAEATLWQRSHTIRALARFAVRGCLLAATLLLLGRLFREIDWCSVRRELREVGSGVILIVLAPIVGQTVHMLGWRALIERPWRPPLWRAFRIFIAAQAGNEIGAGILGESVKIVSFPKEQRAVATRAVFWDNLTSLTAIGFVSLTLGLLSMPGFTDVIKQRKLPIVLSCVAAALVGLYWFSHRARFCRRPPLVNIALAFGAHCLGKGWIVAEFALVLAFTATATWHSSTVLGLASILGTSIGAPLPGQVGVVEAALLSSAQLARLAPATILCVAILRRVRGLAWVLLGMGFCAAMGTTAYAGRHNGTVP